jgi:hypothetical protein
LAIYLLNFSIDGKDFYPDYLPEDLEYNDIESFYEFFLEVVLGIENAVAENDEQDPDNGGSIHFCKFYAESSFKGPTSNKYLLLLNADFSSVYSFVLSSNSIEIDSPPPRA